MLQKSNIGKKTIKIDNMKYIKILQKSHIGIKQLKLIIWNIYKKCYKKVMLE